MVAMAWFLDRELPAEEIIGGYGEIPTMSYHYSSTTMHLNSMSATEGI